MLRLAHPSRHIPSAAMFEGDPRLASALSPSASAAGGTVALLRVLDTLEHGFAFHDRGGRILHANRSYQRILADPAFAALDEEVRRFVAALWGAANVRRLGGAVEALDARPLRLECGECRLQGMYVGVDLFGEGPSVLVGVRVPSEAPYSAERLRERFGLTRKQSRVALLLTQGLRNDEIARRLFISTHTARHHVEQVRLKVGGHTRAAVAARILQAETRVNGTTTR